MQQTCSELKFKLAGTWESAKERSGIIEGNKSMEQGGISAADESRKGRVCGGS